MLNGFFQYYHKIISKFIKINRCLKNNNFFDQALESKIQHEREQRAFAEKFAQFEALLKTSNRQFTLNWIDRYPCLTDKTQQTSFDRHYIYHPAWAARILAKIQPQRHVDISSTLHFCSLISAFIPVDFYDFRPANLLLTGLTTSSADLTQLPFADSSINSLSCMHVLEHIGLGRYGDLLDPNGDLKAIHELIRVLNTGGDLLIVVPVGRQRIMFNAHRIYEFLNFKQYFKKLKLVEFTLIPDDKSEEGLVINPPIDITNQQEYGCGCFWFKK